MAMIYPNERGANVDYMTGTPDVEENNDLEIDQVDPIIEDQEKNAPSRVGTRLNKDGTESTHLMRAEQLPSGNWVSFPSLFQNKDGSWVDMSNEKNWKETYKEARKRGEVINFGENKEEALAYGKGSWKENQETFIGPMLEEDPVLDAPISTADSPTKEEERVFKKQQAIRDFKGIKPLNETQMNSIASSNNYDTIVDELSKYTQGEGFKFTYADRMVTEYDPQSLRDVNLKKTFIDITAANGNTGRFLKNETSFMNDFLLKNQLKGDDRVFYKNSIDNYSNEIEDFFKNSYRFKKGVGGGQNYTYFLPIEKGGKGTKPGDKNRSVGDFNYKDQLIRLKKELGVEGKVYEYDFDNLFEKVAKRYSDIHLDNFNKQRDKEAKSLTEDDDVINVKKRYRELNYTTLEKGLVDIDKQISSLQEEISSPSSFIKPTSFILEDKQRNLEKLIKQRNGIYTAIGNSKGWHGVLLKGYTNWNKENALEPAFNSNGDLVEGLGVDKEEEGIITIGNLMDSANKFSASIPKELTSSVSIRDYLEDMTDDIAQKIAISDKIGDQTIKIKGALLGSRGSAKLTSLGYKLAGDDEDRSIEDLSFEVKMSDLAKYKNTIFNPSEKNILEWLSPKGKGIFDFSKEAIRTDDLSESELYMLVDQYAENRKQNMSDFKVLMALTDLNIDPRSYNKRFGSSVIDGFKNADDYLANTWSVEAADKAGLSLKTDFHNKLNIQHLTADFAKTINKHSNEDSKVFNTNAVEKLEMGVAYEFGFKGLLEFTEDLAKFGVVGGGVGAVGRALDIGKKSFILYDGTKKVTGTKLQNFINTFGTKDVATGKYTLDLASATARKAASNVGYTLHADKLKNLYYTGFGVVGEELKMKSVFENDYKLGGGTAFYLTGGAFGRFNLLPSRRLNTLAGIPYSGLAFATSVDMAKILEGGWIDFKGGETFKKQMEDAFPNGFKNDFFSREGAGDFVLGSMLRVKSVAGAVVKNPYANPLTSTAKLDKIIRGGYENLRDLNDKIGELDKLDFQERKKELELEFGRTVDLVRSAEQQLVLSEGDVFDTKDPNKISKHLMRKHGDYFKENNIEVIIQQGSDGFFEKGLNPNDPAGITFKKDGGIVIGVNTLLATRGQLEHEIAHFEMKKRLKNNPKLVGRMVNAIEGIFNNRNFYITTTDEDGKKSDKKVSFREYIEDLYYDKKLTKKEQKELNDIEFLTTATEFLVSPKEYRDVLRQNNNGELTTWTLLKDMLKSETNLTGDMFADKKSIALQFARVVQELSEKGTVSAKSQKFFEDLANRKGKFAGKEYDWLNKDTQVNDVKLEELQETIKDFSSKEKQVDDLVGEKVNDKYTMTKATWDNPMRPGSAKAFEALYAPKESNIFRGIILKGIEGDNVYGRSKDAFVERVQSELARDIMNFNPEVNNSLSGYLANRVIWAKGDILNEFKKSPFEKSIDTKIGELGSVYERGAEDIGIKRFEDTYRLSDAFKAKEDKKLANETGKVLTEKGLIEPLEIITPRPTKDAKVDKANEKQIENIENQILKDKPSEKVLEKSNIANLEPSKELVKLVKPLFGKSRKEQVKNMINNGELYYNAYFPESAMYGVGIVEAGKSSTMISKAFPMFYVPRSERAIKATEKETGKAGTKSGLEIRDRLPWSQAKTIWENMSWSDLKTAELPATNKSYRNQGTALNSFFNQASKVINNREIRRTEDNKKIVQQLVDGNNQYMASKLKEDFTKIRSPLGRNMKDLFNALNHFVQDPVDFKKAYPAEYRIIKNLADAQITAMRGAENVVNFVKTAKDFKLNSAKAKEFGITRQEFQDYIGGISNIQSKKYSVIDLGIAEKYTDLSVGKNGYIEYLPEWLGATMSKGFLGLHRRTNGHGITDAKAKQMFGKDADGNVTAFKKAPEFTKKYDASNQRDKGGFFKNISTDGIKQIGSLKTAYNNARKHAEEGNPEKANEVLDKAFSKLDGKIKNQIYDALQKSKQHWIESSKTKEQFLERSKHVLMMGRNNTNIEGGERQLAEVIAVYRGPVVDVMTKLEHTKPMVQQSVEAALSVINGKWNVEGKKIMENFKGVIGPKINFDIIDLVGKPTNPAGLARMILDFNELQNYQVVGRPGKTLLDVLAERTFQRVGVDLRKKAVLHIKDQLAKAALTGEASDIIIAKNAVKNSDSYKKVRNRNANILEKAGFSSKNKTNNQILNDINNIDKAIEMARRSNPPKKGISVLDFDDTVAKTKSKVIVYAPAFKPGTSKEVSMKLTPVEFAKRHAELERMGASFDFSEFNKVVKGKKGPLFNKLQKAVNKFGNENVFILTARPQESAMAIQTFLEGMGVRLKVENITGLEDGRPVAKAQWIVDKAAEGYNDFYFADDVYKNVKAVQKVLDVIDVKSDIQQAFSAKSKDLNKNINKMIEYSTGIGREKTYSAAKAGLTGKGRSHWKLYMPSRASDFHSLTNALIGKGVKGLENRKWIQENLVKPFSRGDLAFNTERRTKLADYFVLRNQLKETGSKYRDMFKKNPLNNSIEKGEVWTNQHAVRVYNWAKQGVLPKDISKTDAKKLVDHVNNNPKLKAFAEELVNLHKGEGYPEPREMWLSETITQDILLGGKKTSRNKHMKEFIENADIVFSPENLNKMEAAFGKAWRTAMENNLEAMKTGSNRPSWGEGNKWESDFLDWVNGSIGATMFINTRSALLQQVSLTNYVNVTDNNIFAAGKAFANNKQFRKDYLELMNDKWSLNRRDGLRYNVQEAEIAELFATTRNKPAALINWALKKGFILTRFMDSHATAFGGASFYRNRTNTYLKQVNPGTGKKYTKQEAENKAKEDWREMSDATQQTSRMDRVSPEQRSVTGRLVLPFSTVQLAYGRRYIDDAARDLINKRYDHLHKGENSALKKIGQIIYGTAIQGAVFHGLQQAIFKVIFDDGNTLDGEELEVANAILDGILVGSGIAGKAVAVFKNWIIAMEKESKKKNPQYTDTATEFLKISPPIDKKYRQFKGALRELQYNKDDIGKLSLNNPALNATTKIIESVTNAPVDNLLINMQNVEAALEEDRANWQRPFLIGGWSLWNLEDDKKIKKKNTKFKSSKFKKFKTKKFK